MRLPAVLAAAAGVVDGMALLLLASDAACSVYVLCTLQTGG